MKTNVTNYDSIWQRYPAEWLVLIFALVFIIIGMTGCAGGPPTSIEEHLFTVTTNTVLETNVVTVTQTVPQVVLFTNTVTLTNTIGVPVPTPFVVPVTNFVAVALPVTNYTVSTNYNFTPNAAAGTITAAGGLVPGYGELAAALLGGLFGLWGTLRSSSANKTSATLVQAIEVLRNVVATQQGGAVADKVKSWLMQHQTEAGVIQQVAALVNQAVDPDAAKAIAAELTALTKTT